MPKPTQGEIIHDLVQTVAAHSERFQHVESRLAALEVNYFRTNESLNDVKTNLAVLTQRVAGLEKQLSEFRAQQKERSAQMWLILVAAIASVLTFVGNLLLTFFR